MGIPSLVNLDFLYSLPGLNGLIFCLGSFWNKVPRPQYIVIRRKIIPFASAGQAFFLVHLQGNRAPFWSMPAGRGFEAV